MKLRPLAVLALASIAATSLATTACSGDDAPGMVILARVLPGDGEPPAILRLVSMDRAEVSRFPLVRRGRGEEATWRYESAAPTGAYRIESDEGWGAITPSFTLPRYVAGPGAPRNVVTLARPATLYVQGPPGGPPLIPRIVLERRTAEAPERWERIPIEAASQPDGWLLARMPEAVLQPFATLRAWTALEGGFPIPAIDIPLSSEPRHPIVQRVEPAEGPPLQIEAIGRDARDGSRIEIRLTGHPLDPMWETWFAQQRAHASGIGHHPDGLTITVPDWGEKAVWTVDASAWENEQALFLLALPPASGPRVVALPALPGGATPHRVVLRERDENRLGQVPLRASADGAFEMVVPAGEHVGWVQTRDGFVSIEVPAADAAPTLGPLLHSAEVSGDVPGAQGTLRVLAEREEGERWIGGAAFDTALGPGTRYRVTLPPGRYRLAVLRSDLRPTPPRVVPVELEPAMRFAGFDLALR